MNSNGIKAVFFDAADTLFYIKNGLGKTYLDPALKYGVKTTEKDIKNAFARYFPIAPPLAFANMDDDKRKVLEKRWWYNVVKNVYLDIGIFPEFDEYFDELFEIFRSSAWKLFPETVNVLRTLKSKNYKLVVVSNFDTRVYDVCKKLNIMKYFDEFFISSEVGFAKPDPEIFRYALDIINLEGSKCIHIGDNIENDYYCPKKLGINTVFLDREGITQNNNINKISELSDLLKILN